MRLQIEKKASEFESTMRDIYMFKPRGRSLELELELDSVSSLMSWWWEVVGCAIPDVLVVRDVFLAGCSWVDASLVLVLFFCLGL